MELLKGFRTDPDKQRDSHPRRTVAQLLDTAGARRLRAVSGVTAAVQHVLREQQRLQGPRTTRPTTLRLFRRISSFPRVEEPVLGEWCFGWSIEHPGMDGLNQGPGVLP